MSKQMLADLHTHTTASDGTYNPKELIHRAKFKGLCALGITDHDTTDGLDEAERAGEGYSVEVIPGIELNTQMDGKEVHILGYFIQYKLAWLQDLLGDIRGERYSRAEKMVGKLIKLYNMDLSFQDILNRVKDENNIGRPHIARAMIEKGIVRDIPEAFDKYIGEGRPAYVGRYKLSVKEGIDVIKDAGGVPVLAHPGLIQSNSIVEKSISLGLIGIEAYHSKHTARQSEHYANIGRTNGLIITGGSDYHGEITPDVGDVTVDYSVVAQLKKVAK